MAILENTNSNLTNKHVNVNEISSPKPLNIPQN
jgi:hypothetical protein